MPRRNLLALAFVSALLPTAAASEKPGIVSVTGESVVNLAPDLAIVNLSVVSQEKTARAALSANNAAMGAVIEALKAQGVRKSDLLTSGPSIKPRYSERFDDDRSREPEIEPGIVGYSVSNTLTARLRDLDRVGIVLDTAVTLGVNRDGRIFFTNEDPSAAIVEAHGAAMKNAIAKAKALVEASGASLGRIVQIGESYTSRRHRRDDVLFASAQRSSRDRDAGVPVEIGENAYLVYVTVSFEIEP